MYQIRYQREEVGFKSISKDCKQRSLLICSYTAFNIYLQWQNPNLLMFSLQNTFCVLNLCQVSRILHKAWLIFSEYRQAIWIILDTHTHTPNKQLGNITTSPTGSIRLYHAVHSITYESRWCKQNQTCIILRLDPSVLYELWVKVLTSDQTY